MDPGPDAPAVPRKSPGALLEGRLSAPARAARANRGHKTFPEPGPIVTLLPMQGGSLVRAVFCLQGMAAQFGHLSQASASQSIGPS